MPDQMNRRAFLTVAVGGMVTAMPALAGSFVDEIVRRLRALGFTDIKIKTTLLGRTQIIAVRGDGAREIIFNPRTGEILRDLWVGTDGRSSPSSLVDFDGSGSGSGGGTDDTGDDNSGEDNSNDNSGSDDDPSDDEDSSDNEDGNAND